MIRLLRLVLLPALALVLAVAPGRAAEPFTPDQRADIVRILREALVADPSILRDAVTAMQTAERVQQEDTARSRVAANAGKLVAAADPAAGNPKGDVTIVEFFDVRCPYCKRMEQPMAALLAGDRQVRLVYKDLPVLGPASLLGAKALLAAQRQGRYEPLRAALMRTDQPITQDSIRAEAQKLGLDWSRLARDMDDPAIAAQLDGNLKLASSLGIEGTPAFVIGDALVPGAIDLEQLQRAVATTRLVAK